MSIYGANLIDSLNCFEGGPKKIIKLRFLRFLELNNNYFFGFVMLLAVNF